MARQKNLVEKTEDLGVISAAESSSAVDVSGGQTLSAQVVVDVMSGNKAFASTDVDVDEDTITIASHGFLTGTEVQLTTSGALPTGVTTLTDYYVIRVDANTIQLAASASDAEAGNALDLTAAGSGSSSVNPVAISGASVTLQKSNDGTNWASESATNITTDGSIAIDKTDPTFRYYRVTFAISAGSMDISILWLVKGIDG